MLWLVERSFEDRESNIVQPSSKNRTPTAKLTHHEVIHKKLRRMCNGFNKRTAQVPVGDGTSSTTLMHDRDYFITVVSKDLTPVKRRKVTPREDRRTGVGKIYWNQTSYQDLKSTFLDTDDAMGELFAREVFQRVEDKVEEMVEEVLLVGQPKQPDMFRADPPEDVAKMLLFLKG